MEWQDVYSGIPGYYFVDYSRHGIAIEIAMIDSDRNVWQFGAEYTANGEGICRFLGPFDHEDLLDCKMCDILAGKLATKFAPGDAARLKRHGTRVRHWKAWAKRKADRENNKSKG